VQVWLGDANSARDNARYLPPPAETVPMLVDEWLDWWHRRHHMVRGQSKGVIVAGLAEFHHRFLIIHPFTDANGRVARVITDQAARELLNQSIGREFIQDVAAYYRALEAADEGDLTLLENRIKALQ